VRKTQQIIGASSLVRRLVYWSLVLLVALFVFIQFCRTSGVGDHGPAKLNRLVTWTADRPFAYRVLLPLIANTVSPFIDPGFALAAGQRSERLLGEGFFYKTFDGRTYPQQALVILGLMFLSVLGFAISMQSFVKELGYRHGIQLLAPPVLLLGSMPFMEFGYVYDWPNAFLFSLGLLLMLQRRWVAYLAVFLCATLNKETSVFLTLPFAIFFFTRLSRRAFWLLLSGQLAAYGLIQALIRSSFQENQGAAVQWHLPDQLLEMRRAMGDPLQLLVSLVPLILIVVLVLRGWSRKPQFLRDGLVLLPVFFILYVLWGYPSEIRVMLEVYPVVAVLMLPPGALIQLPAGIGTA
jgi:hypothetical protein